MKKLLADCMINAADSTLDKRPEALHAIRVNVADDVNFGAMFDSPVGVAEPGMSKTS